jgi:hypothetical protein
MSNFGSRILGFFGGNASGGGGGTNPTSGYIPYNNSGSFADSFWFVDATGTYSTYDKGTGTAYGFQLDIINYISYVGDISIDFSWLEVDNVTQHIKTKTGNIYSGIYIDRTINVEIGDYAGNYNTSKLIIADDATDLYIKSFFAGVESGIRLDYLNNLYDLGKFTAITRTTTLSIDSPNDRIYTSFNGVRNGLYLDGNGENYYLGDFDNNVNGNYIKIDYLSTKIGMYYGGASIFGFEIDYAVGVSTYRFGQSTNNIFFDVNTQITLISTANSNQFGFAFDEVSRKYFIGDYNALSNGTYFGVNDIDKELFASNNLYATGVSPVGTSDYLKVYVANQGLKYIKIYQ